MIAPSYGNAPTKPTIKSLSTCQKINSTPFWISELKAYPDV